MAESVTDWLSRQGLSKYAAAFTANDITPDMLSDLGADDLRELGLTVGDRKRFERALAPSPQPGARPPAPARRGGERRQLTVVFIDMVGSTALAERLDLEDYRHVIAAFQTTVTDAMNRFRGTVARYMGDGVMIYFGYPSAGEDDPERAIRASLDVIDTLARVPPARGVRPQVRIGIATGLVVVGDVIGEGMSEEHAVLGGIPNLAARLQSCAEPDTVIVADATRRLAGGSVEFEFTGERSLRGISAPARTWRALGVRGGNRFDARATAATSPIIGRRSEFDTLGALWQACMQGHGRFVLIRGEAGIGKSRLVEELRRLAAETTPDVHVLQCSTFHQNSPLHPLAPWLRAQIRALDDDPQSTDAARLQAWAARFEGGPSLALLAGILGLETADPAHQSATEAEDDRRTLLGWLTRLATDRAARGPVLLVVEDVHWADASTREWLSQLGPVLAQHRLLVLVTVRAEMDPGIAPGDDATIINLGRLDRADALEIVRYHSGRPLPAELSATIAERSDGIPLFIEELTSSVLHAIGDASGAGSTSSRDAISVPDTLHDSLMGRLDRLGIARRLAQVGAAIGRTFSLPLLGAASDLPAAEFDDAVAELSASGLVDVASDAATLSFRHALVRDVAHDSLLRDERTAIHRRIAEVLLADELRDDDSGAFDAAPETIGRHLLEAHAFEAAAGHFATAGAAASRRSANAEAVGHYQAALGAVARLADGSARDRLELDLRVRMNNALGSLHGWGESAIEENFERVSVLSERVGSTEYLLPSGFMGWSMYYLSGSMQRAIAVAQNLLAQAERLGDAQMEMVGHRCMGINLMTTGELVAAEHHHSRVEALFDAGRDEALTHLLGAHVLPTSVANRAVGLWFRGHVADARRLLDRARQLALATDHANTIGSAFVTAAVSGLIVGEDIDVVASDLETADTFIRRHNLRTWALSASFCHRFVQLHRGQIREALDGLRRDGTGPQPWYRGRETHVPGLLACFAEGVLEAGLADIAYQILEAAERRQRLGEGRWGDPEIKRVRGVIQLALGGGRDEVELALADAVRAARAQHNVLHELRALNNLAGIELTPALARDIRACVHAFGDSRNVSELDAARALLRGDAAAAGG